MSSGVDLDGCRALTSNWNIFFKDVIDKVADRALEIIKTPGVCPVGEKEYDPHSGALMAGHKAVWAGNATKQIISEMEYWKFVVINHRVLTTEKARKWWFGVFLKEHPDFQRKTPGGNRQVLANQYQVKAINILLQTGACGSIVQVQLNKFLAGEIR